MTENNRIHILLQEFADGTISKEDYNLLIYHFQLEGNDEEIFAAMDQIWSALDDKEWHSTAELDQNYEKLSAALHLNTTAKVVPAQRLWYSIAAAAVVLIALGIGISIYSNKELAPASERFAKSDISPGGNHALLTLANGKTISLNDAANGELATEAGISVTKTKNGQLLYSVKGTGGTASNNKTAQNTISTPRGGQYQVNLPDGTSVWLNAASSIQFPLQFNDSERRVNLRGEAYFEVAKVSTKKLVHGKLTSAALPFIVETERQELKVLGTHFNINAYDVLTKTTLLEGAVTVSALPTATNARPELAYLQPGQQSVLRGNRFKITVADTEDAMAWKNGVFLFSGHNLDDIMKEVERWYDVDVEFEDSSLKQQTFGGTISRFKNISQLLEVLESTGSVHFKMQGRRIIAMK